MNNKQFWMVYKVDSSTFTVIEVLPCKDLKSAREYATNYKNKNHIDKIRVIEVTDCIDIN